MWIKTVNKYLNFINYFLKKSNNINENFVFLYYIFYNYIFFLIFTLFYIIFFYFLISFETFLFSGKIKWYNNNYDFKNGLKVDHNNCVYYFVKN